ncbi:MAG: 5-formyltetrahydrofolate cyclo-ligase [Gammaproteobacteria bacterium]|nr:5-formyltetrahydrofolate cyclo-ligase [Gammaproteobacteria bacterium]
MRDAKCGLRVALRRCRRRLGAGERRRLAMRACARARAVVGRARRIGAYLPHGSELDPQWLMRRLERAGHDIYVPLVGRRSDQVLRFTPWRAPFLTNRYGIREPRRGHTIKASELDLIIVPVVGFDARGTRLGQGGGHYDRTLAHLGRAGLRPRRVGLAFECQRVASLPRDRHDVPLTAVVTENRVYRGFGSA